MSLATSALPLSVKRPATAKLLLPTAASRSTPDSQRLSLDQLPITAASNVGSWELGVWKAPAVAAEARWKACRIDAHAGCRPPARESVEPPAHRPRWGCPT